MGDRAAGAMRAVLVTAALLAGVAAAAAAPKPWFCHGLDCPEYTVLETTDAYEVREYAPGGGLAAA